MAESRNKLLKSSKVSNSDAENLDLESQKSIATDGYKMKVDVEHSIAESLEKNQAIDSSATSQIKVIKKQEKIPFLTKLVFSPAYVSDAAVAANYEGSGTKDDPYLVEWLPNDPYNPLNFTNFQKAVIMVALGLSALTVTFISSALSPAIPQLMEVFGTTVEVSTLAVSLFVLGFALGPLIWAPTSEIKGRRVTFIYAYAGMTIFCVACCVAQTIPQLLLFRFIAGCFGSSPLITFGGVIYDTFSVKARGPVSAFYSTAPSLGPTLGPIVAVFVAVNYSWRWVCGLMAIFSGVVWIILTFFLPETFSPLLLNIRAKKLSKKTGKIYISKLSTIQKKKSVKETYKIAFSRPIFILFKELIVFVLSLYLAIIYGTLYMLFGALFEIFSLRGWSSQDCMMPLFSVAIGMIIGCAAVLVDNKRYMRAVQAHNGFAPPETRLPPAILGGLSITMSLFWFAWTNSPSVHWIISVTSLSLFGFGVSLCFLPFLTYLVDSYLIYSASALAANTIFRSLFGFAFPLFTHKMIANLGIHWGISVPAFLSLSVLPFPVLFWKYGGRIRKNSCYASEADAFNEKLKQMTIQSAVN